MTVTMSAPPTTATETTEILRFLHRFTQLMSTGGNSDDLLRAAKLLENQVDTLKETEDLLQVERVRGDVNAETRKALENRIGELESEVSALKSQLCDQQVHVALAMADIETRQSKLIERAEDAESRLVAVESQKAAPGSIIVPLETLRLAKAQFESLARAFAQSGNIVSRVMCEASASRLDRVMLDSGAGEAEIVPNTRLELYDEASAIGRFS
jgi:hypothetical protein